MNAGEQRSPDFLLLNPKGRIPLLETPFGSLTENPEILGYIASLAPCSWPPGGRWAKTESALQDRKAQVADNMLAAFELIEQTLQIRPWVLGQDFSIADAYLHTFARWLALDRVDTRALNRVLGHRARMAQRPAAQAVLAAEGMPYSGNGIGKTGAEKP